MADLDDFFAKKDRKKAKGKKFTTTEEIAKKLEETGKKVDKPKPKEKPANPDGGDDSQQVEEEDEWRVFEEKKKDYSGLKIGNLTVTETVPTNDDNDSGTGENSSDGESGEGGGKHSGPWKKTDNPAAAAAAAAAAPVPEPEPAPQAPEQAPKSSQPSTYRPPQQRNPQLNPHNDRPMGRLRNKNIAPDINSEEYFPTLNSKPPANDAGGVWGRKKRDEGTFEEVRNRGGSRLYQAPQPHSQAPNLSLGNKYGALQDQS